jgi:Helix-turn-helix domain
MQEKEPVHKPTTELLTAEEAAAIIHVHPRSIYRAIMGQLGGTAPLPALKWGRRYFFKRAELMRWVDANYAVQTPIAPRKRKSKTPATTNPTK